MISLVDSCSTEMMLVVDSFSIEMLSVGYWMDLS